MRCIDPSSLLSLPVTEFRRALVGKFHKSYEIFNKNFTTIRLSQQVSNELCSSVKQCKRKRNPPWFNKKL